MNPSAKPLRRSMRFPGDAIAPSHEVTPQQSIKPSRGTERLLAIVTKSLPFSEFFYCKELFGIPSNKVIHVSRWGELVAEITAYERIDTLVIVTHGAPGELLVGSRQRLIIELANGAKDSDPFTGLKYWSGSIGTLKLEGCSLGADPKAVYEFAEAVNVTRIEAWTMGHYLSLYDGITTGDRADAVDKWLKSGRLERASPWLLKNGDGATWSVKELEQELLKNGEFAHIAEVFGNSLPFGDKKFSKLMNDPNFNFDPDVHFPRAVGVRETWEIRSSWQAAELTKKLNPPLDGYTHPEKLHKIIAIPL